MVIMARNIKESLKINVLFEGLTNIYYRETHIFNCKSTKNSLIIQICFG